MGMGVSLLLIAAGAILAFATEYVAVGWILLYVGAFGVGVSIVFWSRLGLTARRRSSLLN
jgi:hypothetical protein